MSADKELIERVAEAMFHTMESDLIPSDFNSRFGPQFAAHARVSVAVMRAYDREQRAKIDEALARHNEARHGGMNMYVETRRDPDDYRDPFSLVTRMARGPGITEG